MLFDSMDRQEQVQTLGSLYLLYKSHCSQLQAVGYTKAEAFWLNFACLPFLPWAEQSENRFNLTQVLRPYHRRRIRRLPRKFWRHRQNAGQGRQRVAEESEVSGDGRRLKESCLAQRRRDAESEIDAILLFSAPPRLSRWRRGVGPQIPLIGADLPL